MCTHTSRDAPIEISPERKEFKEKKKKSEEKQRKEKKEGGEKTGSKGVSPFVLQIQTFQKKERIKGLAMKGKIKGRKSRNQENAHSQSCQ